ncbi:MAG TPA: hypothetical protein VLN48_21800 [Bryobacteraceae bacterium]|nr:hypothetical protein [Bryobacteraceae bacterium]
MTTRRRHTSSNLLLALLWLGFVGLWVRVFQRTELKDVGVSLGLLLGLGGLYGLTVAIWVGHNISLARRRNRRRANEEITIFPSHDYLGLPVEIRSNLVTEQEIEIRISNGVKQYLVADKSVDIARLDEAVTADRRVARPETGDLVSKPGGAQ